MTALTVAFKNQASALAAAGRFISEIFAGLAEGQEIARRYDELSRLSDEALLARGITREQLPQAIIHGRIGR